MEKTAPFSSYFICTTPRSGSTMLCDMLTATGEAGRPNSYFRAEDVGRWADRWSVDTPGGADDGKSNEAYVSAMIDAGTADTGVFGLRLMWSSMADVTSRLKYFHGGRADAASQFENVFGPILYVHLSRRDKVAQAISLARAEQSGLWHLAADGSERQRTYPAKASTYNAGRIAALRNELIADDAAWSAFFAAHRIEPLRLTYEAFTADPCQALADILSALGRNPATAWKASPATARMADAVSTAWGERFRRDQPAD